MFVESKRRRGDGKVVADGTTRWEAEGTRRRNATARWCVADFLARAHMSRRKETCIKWATPIIHTRKCVCVQRCCKHVQHTLQASEQLSESTPVCVYVYSRMHTHTHTQHGTIILYIHICMYTPTKRCVPIILSAGVRNIILWSPVLRVCTAAVSLQQEINDHARRRSACRFRYEDFAEIISHMKDRLAIARDGSKARRRKVWPEDFSEKWIRAP